MSDDSETPMHCTHCKSPLGNQWNMCDETDGEFCGTCIQVVCLNQHSEGCVTGVVQSPSPSSILEGDKGPDFSSGSTALAVARNEALEEARVAIANMISPATPEDYDHGYYIGIGFRNGRDAALEAIRALKHEPEKTQINPSQTLLDECKEALRPFAEEAARWSTTDDTCITHPGGHLLVSDVRRARSILSKIDANALEGK